MCEMYVIGFEFIVNVQTMDTEKIKCGLASKQKYKMQYTAE